MSESPSRIFQVMKIVVFFSVTFIFTGLLPWKTAAHLTSMGGGNAGEC